MEKSIIQRNARVTVYGIKKRCRKISSEIVAASADTDVDAIELLKEKVKELIADYRHVEKFSQVTCQDVELIDRGDYQIKKMMIFCPSEVKYEFTL